MTLNISQWADRLGISKNTIVARRRKGLPAEEVLSLLSKRAGYKLRVGRVRPSGMC
jgi:hypothetical protein